MDKSNKKLLRNHSAFICWKDSCMDSLGETSMFIVTEDYLPKTQHEFRAHVNDNG